MIIFKKKSNMRIGNIQLDFSISFSRLAKGFAIGTYSICSDGKHCVYLDYDNFRKEWMLDELRELRNKYKLSNFYIFASSIDNNGKEKYHAVCFDKLTARQYNDLVSESNADMLFRKNHFFDKENSRVLRFSAKSESQIGHPIYVGYLESNFNARKKSSSHLNFYKNMFNIPDGHINRNNEDNNDDLRVISYMTKNI